VHAGVPPAIVTLPEGPQEIVTYAWKQRDLYMHMQRIRFVSREGKNPCSLAPTRRAVASGQNGTMAA
jgi:hypothetical protein